jgi:protease I
MQFGLKGRHVAVLAADGVDGARLAGPRGALGDAGASVDVLAARGGEVRGSRGEPIAVDRTLDVCHAADFDALIIPDGRQGAHTLATEQSAVQLVREFLAADKPVAAIGDGVRLLIVADTVAGRRIAASRPLADDVRSAGGEPVEAPLEVDEGLITARTDVDARELNAAIVREFSNRVDEARVDAMSEQSFPASDPPPGPVSVGGEGASTALHLDPRVGDRKPESRSESPESRKE